MVQLLFHLSDCCQKCRTNYWRWSEIPRGPPPERRSLSIVSGRAGEGMGVPASPIASRFAPQHPAWPAGGQPKCWKLEQQQHWYCWLRLSPLAECNSEIIWAGRVFIFLPLPPKQKYNVVWFHREKGHWSSTNLNKPEFYSSSDALEWTRGFL